MQFRQMEEKDFDEILQLMVKGFTHSTLYAWAAPDMEERILFLHAMFRRRIRSWLDSSYEVELALTDEGRIAGSATWMPPVFDAKGAGSGVGKSSAQKPPQAGHLDDVFAGRSPALVEKWSKFQPVIEAQHHSLSGSFWSLAPIVIASEEQGKGIASLLLRKKLTLIDDLPCFLATQDRINLPIYERFGFIKTEEIPVADGLTSFSMVREASKAPLNS
jgi:GNAT superfamily N-acetyltransferase